jgi:hypothetical protein
MPNAAASRSAECPIVSPDENSATDGNCKVIPEKILNI